MGISLFLWLWGNNLFYRNSFFPVRYWLLFAISDDWIPRYFSVILYWVTLYFNNLLVSPVILRNNLNMLLYSLIVNLIWFLISGILYISFSLYKYPFYDLSERVVRVFHLITYGFWSLFEFLYGGSQLYIDLIVITNLLVYLFPNTKYKSSFILICNLSKAAV